MNRFARMMMRIVMGIPSILIVFFAAGFLDNAINLFINVYGSDEPPIRATSQQVAAIVSLLAAATWTTLAAKIEQIERAVDVGRALNRKDERERTYELVWRRLSVNLLVALALSVATVIVLVDR